ncbi:hypothetical protein M422DRAFT_253490 [Sphaerobolus stellatus SS14]|uniref:Uncharacterized protein n=1 Tax=Sphaerobolus stellatus (strain SS14) TaxID=990650 RepID=A0A0C9V8H4_SPHS4|nr:hypothetical protein M422DRAFT_253490 [Sphaerobolus stellatus SS14]
MSGPPNRTDSTRINPAPYGYPNCAVPNQQIHIPYDSHGPRDPDENNSIIEGPNGSPPHGFPQPPLSLNPYTGVPMGPGATTSHMSYPHPSQNSLMCSQSSESCEQSAKPAITEEDTNIYAAFLEFRSCLQKYVHLHADSSASVKLFWKSIHNSVETSSQTA